MTTPDRLSEIRERLARATPGPWETRYRMSGAYNVEAVSGQFIAETGTNWEMARADSAFIAHAPTDIAFLLDELTLLRSQRDAADELTHGMNCPALTPGEDCMCGLEWRRHLRTEQTMHAAWRKRAEEAERENAELRQQRDAAVEALKDASDDRDNWQEIVALFCATHQIDEARAELAQKFIDATTLKEDVRVGNTIIHAGCKVTTLITTARRWFLTKNGQAG